MQEGKKISSIILIKTALFHLLSDVAAIFMFAVAMYFLEGGYEFSPLFGTLALSVGCLISALYLGNKLGEKGIIIGAAIGVATFVPITLISLLVNHSSVSIHLLLRLVIMILASLIGAIIGVNRKSSEKLV